MNCWNCNTELIWGSDFDIDHEDESYSMMTALHCPNCKCDVEVWYPRRMTMSKTWIVWVDLTHRIEVEAENMDEAREEAVDTIWDETNMVGCHITVEQETENG